MSGLFGNLSFGSPWVLFALAGLPVLWWLLRVTPPAPRREVFPAIGLLFGLNARSETAARTPLWLLALRMLAAALVIVALARPVFNAGGELAGSGPLLLVIDDGWAAAPAWTARMAAAQSALDRAEHSGRSVSMLSTAPPEDGSAPVRTGVMPVADLRTRLAALHPKPWGTDRAAATAALQGVPAGPVVYVGDGLGDDAAFAKALAGVGAVEELRDVVPPVLLPPPESASDRLVVKVLTLPVRVERVLPVLAQSGDGRTLARIDVEVPADADRGTGALIVPAEIRNQLARLVVQGVGSAGSVALLDERWRRRPVGLLAGESVSADIPLTGPLYYLSRALQPFVELREGDLSALLSRELSVLILADHVVTDGPERAQLEAWVQKGGTLIRFAGPATAEHPDTLLPVKLLGGDRQLGGAMSWTQPPGLAAFDTTSPFAGLVVPDEIRITRQVLADPESLRPTVQNGAAADLVWARLADGTPLVTAAPRGAGRIVLFHVTANADWSDLPLSGLFVEMLRRLVAQALGVASNDAGADATPLAPVETLDGFGTAGTPPSAAVAIAANAGRVAASPRHPPGVYGPETNRHVLNLGDGATVLTAAPFIAGASEGALAANVKPKPVAAVLMAIGLALLALDLLISLPLRGLGRGIGRNAAAVALMVAFVGPVHAATNPPEETNPALVTRLAYLVTGDSHVDEVSLAGLVGLSDYVNRRTNAALAAPAGVQPGQDDLSFYPLLYWPVTADAATLSGAAIQALNDYMSHGGIILIDTRDGGTGEGMVEGSRKALARIGGGLNVPALTPLTSAHVLARSFYLLQEFPGRYTGDTVWVQSFEDRNNDSVSPVVVGAHDWAAAWAVDAQGRNPYATLPGGARQRVLAYRFGVNLVMYSLTGNYKGDQVHVPALLERLGQ